MCAGGDPDQLRGALPLHVTTGGVPLDDDENQTDGRAVGQRHPLPGRQAEPDQAAEEEGELDAWLSSQDLSEDFSKQSRVGDFPRSCATVPMVSRL